MFLSDDFSFYQKHYTSPASRNTFYFYNKWNIKNKHKRLTLRKKSNSGRNITGKIAIRTKTSILIRQKSIKINYSFRYLRLGLIAAFTFIPFRNKLLSLIFFNNGSATYFLTAIAHVLFSFTYFNKKKKLKRLKRLKSIYLMIFQIKKLSFVSCLELLPGSGSKYARSSGTKSKIIKFDKNNHTALIQLPSGVKKIFSYYSFVMLDQLALPEHKRYKNGKAGYWRSFGSKSTVRGVAMNPVDHPHGGRTKSVRYQRTPWGKTTKYK